MAKVNRRIQPVKKAESSLKGSLMNALKIAVRYCQWFLTAVAALGLVGVAGFYSYNAVSSFLNRPIDQVVINSRFEYVSRQVVSDKANNLLQGSFIGESILRVQQDIQSLAWVDEVTIARTWPDKVIITVHEQAPIARWSDKGFVNVRGELVFTTELDGLVELPELRGEESQVVDIIEKYSVITQMLHPYALAVSELQKDARGAWQVRLRNEWSIVLGRGQILQKMNHLIQLMDQQLINPGENIATIDVRYPNGVSVKWNPEDQENIDALSANVTSISNRKSITESGHSSQMTNTRG